ncbi:MAG: hypothetical protein GWP08_07330 [Nitrospiraceae bacterium]|nr:hypothetical protein [Nitrospiraceae bacterium]
MLPFFTALCLSAASPAWDADFAKQPSLTRPALEVCYTGPGREAFEVIAEDYHVVGQLRRPHHLVAADGQALWLSLSVVGADGNHYRTDFTEEASRINLYRRGPYFCEVHWLDVQVADSAGNLAPLKGDLALYCYPEKMLASITWHATADFEATAVRIEGLAAAEFTPGPFAKDTHQQFAFPVFGEEAPLPEEALKTIDAHRPLHYDTVRGCYTIGSRNPGGFDAHFYNHPDYREQVKFSVRNTGSRPRKIYVCHETSDGAPGLVEGGVVLDADGHMLPLTVQVSKNFAGEKEEAFYNPTDIPFSENFFPLYLEPDESHTLTALHLYQNWGRHMTKHFSSLGAWMDYFHSSTGITETTCYVPFKFGGLSGVTIADFRAMSQKTFWAGQAQHDNVAGHNFLMYNDGEAWRYSTYRGTTYDSTGPNWMDIGLHYLTSDGKMRGSVRTFEFPQADELRNFIHVKYEALEDVYVPNARAEFRLLNVSWRVQQLKYTHCAATGTEDIPLSFDNENYPLLGHRLPRQNGFVAMFGEPKGSNAVVIRNWEGPVEPGASILCQEGGKTRMFVSVDADELILKAGDVIEFDAFWLPYGEVHGSKTPRREVAAYGSEAPRIPEVAVGEKVAGFPPEVRAVDNKAEFILQGGRDAVAVLVSGLTDYKWPRIWREESTGWKLVNQARNGDLDGIQTYVAKDGSFGAVFIVNSNNTPQRLRVQVGEPVTPAPRITVKPLAPTEGDAQHIALIQAPWMDAPIKLRYPETVNTDALDFIDHTREDMPPRTPSAPLAKQWNEDVAGTLAFHWRLDKLLIGGRLSPNEEDIDLQFWVQNTKDKTVPVSVQFCPLLGGTMFEDRALERTWIHADGQWVRMSDTGRGAGERARCHYFVEGSPPIQVPSPWGVGEVLADADVVAVTSPDGKHIFGFAWPQVRSILSNANIPCVHADPLLPDCPPNRRVHQRGKIYLMEGTLDDLLARVQRDILRGA